jgi:hypothetical protein
MQISKSDILCCHDVVWAVFRVQGPFLNIEQILKIMKNSYKIREKCVKNRNSTQCCHDVEGAVFRVQGPNLNIEQIQKIIKNG